MTDRTNRKNQGMLGQALSHGCESENGPVVSDSMHAHGHTVRGVLQARTLGWVAVPVSRGSSQPMDRTQVSCIAGGLLTS